MTVMPVMRFMAKNHQKNLPDLQPSDFFRDLKPKRVLLFTTFGIQHNVMRFQHVLLEHAHMSG